MINYNQHRIQWTLNTTNYWRGSSTLCVLSKIVLLINDCETLYFDQICSCTLVVSFSLSSSTISSVSFGTFSCDMSFLVTIIAFPTATTSSSSTKSTTSSSSVTARKVSSTSSSAIISSVIS